MKRILWGIIFVIVLFSQAHAAHIKCLVLYEDTAYLIVERQSQNQQVMLEAPPELIQDSISAVPLGGGTISGIEVEPQRQVSGKAGLIQEKIKEKQSELELKKRQQSMVEKQIEIIFNAADATRKEASFPKTRMQEALSFIDMRVNALNARHIRLGREIETLAVQVKDLEEQLRGLSQRQGFQIIVKADGVVRVSYAVRAASWKPEYALYALPGKAELRVEAAARIQQNTGMDWEVEELVFATGQPGFGIQAPELTTWTLSPQHREPRQVMALAKSAPFMAEAAAPPLEDMEPEVKATATAYILGAARSVALPGDGTPRRITFLRKTCPAQFYRICVPKREQAVFLRAEAGWAAQAPLTAGSYSAFVDGEYTGKGQLAAIQPGETLKIDLGKDPSVRVTRDEKVFHEKTLSGKDMITATCTVSIENLRSNPLRIRVKDQIPVSQDEHIKVSLKQIDPQVTPDDNGLLQWELDCQPREKKVLKFIFSVTGMPYLR